MQDEVRDTALELGRFLLRGRDAIRSPVFSREHRCRSIVGPGGSEPALLFVAEREVDERAGRGILSLALGELRARFVVSTLVEQPPAVSKERFGSSRITQCAPRPSEQRDRQASSCAGASEPRWAAPSSNHSERSYHGAERPSNSGWVFANVTRTIAEIGKAFEAGRAKNAGNRAVGR